MNSSGKPNPPPAALQRARGNSGGAKLRDWRAQGYVPARAIAEKIACSERTVYRWEQGLALPNLHHALQIEGITKGAVRVADWSNNHTRGGK